MSFAPSSEEKLGFDRKGGARHILGLTKQERVRRNRQFREIYTRGQRVSGPHLCLFFMPNKLAVVRLGLSVRKKRFRLSCRRHYIKRRLREAFRLNKMRFLPGYDIILSAHRFTQPQGNRKAGGNKGEQITLQAIEKEMLWLAQKAGVLKCSKDA